MTETLKQLDRATCLCTAGQTCDYCRASKADAAAVWREADAAKATRADRMPDERAAIIAMFEAHQRLIELGWKNAIYCPKDGTHFQAIEAGSTGIHDCNYQGEWPKGGWWVYDGDIWPSRPVLFRLYPKEPVT